MPLLKASIKDVRKTKKRTLNNKRIISEIRTMVKKAKTSSDPATIKKLISKTTSLIDKAAKNGVFHRNKSARLKRSLYLNIKKQ